MKNYIHCIPLIALSLALISCEMGSEYKKNKKKEYTRDSAVLIKKASDRKIIDSIALVKPVIKSVINIGDQTITITKTAALNNKVVYERDGDYYRYKIPERNQKFLTLRATLASKSKLNGREGKFFPNLNVFHVNGRNEFKFVGAMDINLYKKDNLPTEYLEQIFDYKEKETFVYWIKIDSELKGRYVISVNNPDNTSIDLKNVIGSVKQI